MDVQRDSEKILLVGQKLAQNHSGLVICINVKSVSRRSDDFLGPLRPIRMALHSIGKKHFKVAFFAVQDSGNSNANYQRGLVFRLNCHALNFEVFGHARAAPVYAARPIFVGHHDGHIFGARQVSRWLFGRLSAGFLTLHFAVFAVAPLLTARHVGRDVVKVDKLLALVLASSVKHTFGHRRAATGWRGHKFFVGLPFEAEWVDDIESESGGALDLVAEDVAVLGANAKAVALVVKFLLVVVIHTFVGAPVEIDDASFLLVGFVDIFFGV